jgi:hypothetical protein
VLFRLVEPYNHPVSFKTVMFKRQLALEMNFEWLAEENNVTPKNSDELDTLAGHFVTKAVEKGNLLTPATDDWYARVRAFEFFAANGVTKILW